MCFRLYISSRAVLVVLMKYTHAVFLIGQSVIKSQTWYKLRIMWSVRFVLTNSILSRNAPWKILTCRVCVRLVVLLTFFRSRCTCVLEELSSGLGWSGVLWRKNVLKQLYSFFMARRISKLCVKAYFSQYNRRILQRFNMLLVSRMNQSCNFFRTF